MGLLQTLGNIGSGLSSVLNPLSAGMSIVGTLGGLFGANEDRKMQQRINDQNIQMQRETNANQMQMARDANKLQENMMYANMAWQQEQADRQWQRETEWNDIGAQMQRAAAAGVNPFVALGKGNVGNIAGQMSTPGASSAGISPAVPNLTAPRAEMIQGKWSRTAELINSMSNSIANLAQAKKLGADKKLIDNTMNDIIDNYRAQTRNLNASAASVEQQVQYFDLVKNVRADRERLERDYTEENVNNLKESTNKLRAEINVLAEEVRLKVAQTKATEKQVEVGDSQISLNAATIAHLANVDAQGWKQIEIGLANVAIGRYNAETQRWIAKHPNDMAAAMIQIACGMFGVESPEQLGSAIGQWMGTNDNGTPGQSWTVPGIGKKFLRWYLEKSGVPEKYINKMSGAFHSVEKGIEDFFGASDDKSERSPYDPPTRNVVKP